jgi:hypothetical protein
LDVYPRRSRRGRRPPPRKVTHGALRTPN